MTDGIFGQFDSTVYLGHERLQPLPDPPQPSLVESETILALELAWELPLGSAFNLGAALAAETLTTRREQHDHRDTDSQAVLAELFIEWFTDSPTMSRITVGRQSVSEERGWWWDDTLDAVVIEGESDSLDYQLGVATRNTEISTETIEADPTEDDIYWLLSSVSARLGALGEISAFAIAQRDRSSDLNTGQMLTERDLDESDADLNWLGLRLEREVSLGTAGQLGLRLDSGLMYGKERQVEFVVDEEEEIENEATDVELDSEVSDTSPEVSMTEFLTVDSANTRSQRGWVIDVGLIWQLPVSSQPELSLGYAIASGTRSDRAPGSRTYRETGIDSYSYGEIFDPELSNVEIASIGLALPLGEHGFLELVQYHYRRLHSEDDFGFDTETDSSSRRLGSETGVYLSFNVLEDIYMGLSWVEFRPDDAFSEQRNNKSNLFAVEFEYEFW